MVDSGRESEMSREKSRNDEHEIRGRDALSSLCSIRLNEPLFSKTERATATVSVKKREGGRYGERTAGRR